MMAVGPFVFLLKPAIALAMIIVKMIVAAGYAVTNHTRHMVMVPKDGRNGGVAVYAVVNPDNDREEILIQMAGTDELFTGPLTMPHASTLDDSMIVELTSRDGRTLRCVFEGTRTDPTGAACEDELGAAFELTI